MRSGRLRRAEWTLPVPGLIGIAVVCLVAATAIPLPFTGDQAFYTLGGRAPSPGRLLARDVWDVKQPGIFVFYQAAGGLFGFREFGVHVFELLWQLVLALLVVRVVRDHVRHALALAAAPVLTVGAYYAVASPLQL